jgi:hypothetical protein
MCTGLIVQFLYPLQEQDWYHQIQLRIVPEDTNKVLKPVEAAEVMTIFRLSPSLPSIIKKLQSTEYTVRPIPLLLGERMQIDGKEKTYQVHRKAGMHILVRTLQAIA